MRKVLLIAACLLGIGQSLWAQSNEASLNEWSIVPIQYENKVFVQGEYVDLVGEYDIYTENGTTYIPFRLLADLVSTNEERWRVNWEKTKPNEVMLQVDHMRMMGSGGMVNTGEVTPVIKLAVDSTKAFIGDKEITLSKAPKKIDGKITLPIRAIGEVINKKVSYRKGLIFIGDRVYPTHNEPLNHLADQVKWFLEIEKRAVMPEVIPTPLAYIDEKTIYQEVRYDEKTNQMITELYSQKIGEDPILIKTLEGSDFGNMSNEPTKLYYMSGKEQDKVLYLLDLKTMNSVTLCKVSELGSPEWIQGIQSIEEKEEVHYIVVHYGDWTMGSESLFEVKEGKITRLIGGMAFSSILIEDEAIYYSEMSKFSYKDNFFKYNRRTGETIAVGQKNFAYDMCVEETELGLSSYGVCRNAFIKEDKLYTLGYEAESYTWAKLYQIDLATNEQKAITDFTTEFWPIGNQIYYLDADTHELKVTDLEGNLQKTLVEQEVDKVIVKGDNIYYALQVVPGEAKLGLYQYNVVSEEMKRITQLPIKDFCVTEKGIYYVSAGYDPGLYSWKDGREDWLEETRIKYYEMNEYGIGYATVFSSEGRIQ